MNLNLKSAFQAESSAEGARFEAECRAALEQVGYEIIADHYEDPLARVELDFVVATPGQQANGGVTWIECKGGGARSQTPGVQRTDNVRKATFNYYIIRAAHLLDGCCHGRDVAIPPYVIIYSAPPKPDSRSAKWIDISSNEPGLIHLYLRRDGDDRRRLIELAKEIDEEILLYDNS